MPSPWRRTEHRMGHPVLDRHSRAVRRDAHSSADGDWVPLLACPAVIRRNANSPLKKCATGFATAFLNRRLQAIPHWQSQWHTSNLNTFCWRASSGTRDRDVASNTFLTRAGCHSSHAGCCPTRPGAAGISNVRSEHLKRSFGARRGRIDDYIRMTSRRVARLFCSWDVAMAVRGVDGFRLRRDRDSGDWHTDSHWSSCGTRSRGQRDWRCRESAAPRRQDALNCSRTPWDVPVDTPGWL